MEKRWGMGGEIKKKKKKRKGVDDEKNIGCTVREEKTEELQRRGRMAMVED